MQLKEQQIYIRAGIHEPVGPNRSEFFKYFLVLVLVRGSPYKSTCEFKLRLRTFCVGRPVNCVGGRRLLQVTWNKLRVLQSFFKFEIFYFF